MGQTQVKLTTCVSCKCENISENIDHCCKCVMIIQNNYHHCCECKDNFKLSSCQCLHEDENEYMLHCHTCKISRYGKYTNNDVLHCHLCKVFYKSTDLHCHTCKLSYNPSDLHCCKCRVVYSDKYLHCCLCNEEHNKYKYEHILCKTCNICHTYKSNTEIYCCHCKKIVLKSFYANHVLEHNSD